MTICDSIAERLGFGRHGVEANSYASRYQSLHYRGETPSDSWFACCQSWRATSDDGKDLKKVTAFFGLFLGFLAILLIIGGVLIGCYPNTLKEPILFHVKDVTQYEFLPTYQLMIAIGVFLLLSVVSGSGVCYRHGEGAAKFATCCLLVAFIMVIVVLGCLSYSVSNFESEKLESDMRKDMMKKINNTAPILNSIQRKLECCGVDSALDWQNNVRFSNQTLPDSCCKVQTPNCGRNYKPNDVFLRGCLPNIMNKIITYFIWQISFLAFFCLTAIFIICFCCCIGINGEVF